MILRIGSLLLAIVIPLNGLTLINSQPPKPDHVAQMGRYIIHNSDWVSISTISTLPSVKSYPFVNIISMSDGPTTKGSGVPYLLMTDLDLTGKDVMQDNRVTVAATLAQSDYCKSEDFDPQDPRCARIILTGHLLKVDNTTEEYSYAQNALYSRHPAMRAWVLVHDFYIAKVDIEQVAVLDYFGGVKYVSVEDYLNANGDYVTVHNLLFEDVRVIDLEA